MVHLALKARYHLPFQFYKRDWLPDLENMIVYCGNEQHPKRLHYPGSYSSHFYRKNEDFLQRDSSAWFSGYSALKWIANQVLTNAFSQNLQGCIYDIPLVFGTQKAQICPEDYSAWYIMDLFTKTGKVTEFSFKVIGVDSLAQIMAKNMLNEKTGRGVSLIRPVCKEPITHSDLAEAMQGKVKFQLADLKEVIALLGKQKTTSFLLPPNASEIIKQAHDAAQILPLDFDESLLPKGPEVFKSNLTARLQRQENLDLTNRDECRVS